MTTPNQENLLAAGYREYPQKGDAYRRSLFQKWIRGTDGTKLYAINVWYWVFPHPMREAYTYNVSFYLPEDHDALRVEKENMAIEAAEALFAKVYEVMGCVPDLLNQ